MSVHSLTVPLLVGNSVPTSEVEGFVQGAVRKAQVDIGPDYEFQRADLGVTWAVNRSFVTDTESITIPGLEDTDADGNPIAWAIKITFLSSGNKVVGGKPEQLFEISPAAGADINYPDDVTLVDPEPRPDYAQNYVDAAAASAALAAASVNATLTQWAKNPDQLVSGTVTGDPVTSAQVVWPDGTPGTLTITARHSSGAVTAYNVTYGSPVTKTFTQPTITRALSGTPTNIPAMVVS